MLAKGNVAVEEDTARRRLAMALGWGLAGSILMMAFLGVREDLRLEHHCIVTTIAGSVAMGHQRVGANSPEPGWW